MEGENSQKIQTERATDRSRLQIFTEAGRSVFKKTVLLENKAWDKTDEAAVDSYLLQIAPFANPKIEPSFWQHTILASLYAKILAQKTDMNPIEAKITGKLHDIGTAINPTFIRKEYFGASLLKAIGVRDEIIKSFPPVAWIYGIGSSIESIEEMTPEQNLINVADNLGKMGPDGLFTIEAFEKHAKSQPLRYPPGIWPSARVGYKRLTEKGKQEHAIKLVLDGIRQFQEKHGIDFDELRMSVQAEFEKPENQELLISLLNAQETLDLEVDQKLGRHPVEKVVFDVGGVLLDVSEEEFIGKIAKQVGVGIEKVKEALDKLDPEARAGKMSHEEYLREFAKIVGVNKISEENFSFPEIYRPMDGMQDIVSKLIKNGYDVRIYSDIAPPATKTARRKLLEYYPEINPDKIYYSWEIKASKRNKTSFATVAQMIGGEILFIDDSPTYTTSARLSGLRGFTFRGNPHRKVTPQQRLKDELIQARLILD